MVKRFALSLVIAILFPMLIHFGARVLAPPFPVTNYPIYQQSFNANAQESKEKFTAYQTKMKQAMTDNTTLMKIYTNKLAKIALFFMIPMGFVAVLIGILLRIEAIGSGLMLGGILTIIDGYITYMPSSTPLGNFITLLFIFIVVIVFAWKSLGNKS